MVQQLIIYFILFLACIYVGLRFYSAIKKKEACDSCGLMKAARNTAIKNKS